MIEIINVTITNIKPDFKTISDICKVINYNMDTLRNVAVNTIHDLLDDQEFLMSGCVDQKKKTNLPDDVIKANDMLWNDFGKKLDDICWLYRQKLEEVCKEFDSIFNDERITIRKIINGNTFALSTAMSMGHTKEILECFVKVQNIIEQILKKYDELGTNGKHIVNMSKLYTLNIKFMEANNGYKKL